MNLRHIMVSQTHSSHLRSVSDATFAQEVLQSDKPVLVALLADWSKPCNIMRPVLEAVAHACAGKVEVVTVDADGNPHLSLSYAVQNIPTLLLFEGGRLRGHLVGTATKDAVLNMLRPVTSSHKSQPTTTKR